MLQLNFLATHYKTHYERIRDEKVKRNNEDIEIPLGGLLAQSHTEPQCGATLISERVTRSTPHPSMESQASLSPIAQPQNEVLPENNGEINRPTRGPTRGIQAQGLIDKQGKLSIPIPQLFRAPVGKHAAQLASRIGVEVRTHVIDVGVPRWKTIDESVKAPILQCIMMHDNGGVVPMVIEMYKDTHFNNDTQKWISSESEVLYDKMVQIEIEHNAQEGAIPITQKELFVKGLKTRSGYVKGLGIRPSSSIRTVNREYVTHLEGKGAKAS
ncbi:hypothetical protein RHSIM_Rhsim11G0003100 [Rhododendron simsii]|uniref:Uncharacterized protein n=1 Tax=Rhododendron simsii TaxID=118357 RepID=A0A834G8E9_RHOSS|nr:hypothetical protein RHSIM_Rhsim11G0003100 [Rhododendron simsii]